MTFVGAAKTHGKTHHFKPDLDHFDSGRVPVYFGIAPRCVTEENPSDKETYDALLTEALADLLVTTRKTRNFYRRPPFAPGGTGTPAVCGRAPPSAAATCSTVGF